MKTILKNMSKGFSFLIFKAALACMGGVFFLSACSFDPVIEKPEPLAAVPMKTVWKQQEYRLQNLGLKRMVPYVLQNRVYTADQSGVLHAYNLRTGGLVWEWSEPNLKTHFVTSPLEHQDTIYVGTKEATLLALKLEGKKRWETPLSSLMQVPPVVGEGLVYVRTQEGSITAISEETGQIVWSYSREIPNLTLRVASKPVFSRYGVLVGTADGKLLALHPETGELLWETLIALPSGRTEVERMVDVVADPLVRGDVAFVATYRGKLSAVLLPEGRILWQQDLSTWNDLLALSRLIVVSTTQDQVLAVDQHTGEILWRQESLSGRGLTKPIAFAGSVVVGDQLGQLHYLEPSSGTIVKTTQTAFKAMVDVQVLAPSERNSEEELLVTYDDGHLIRTKL